MGEGQSANRTTISILKKKFLWCHLPLYLDISIEILSISWQWGSKNKNNIIHRLLILSFRTGFYFIPVSFPAAPFSCPGPGLLQWQKWKQVGDFSPSRLWWKPRFSTRLLLCSIFRNVLRKIHLFQVAMCLICCNSLFYFIHYINIELEKKRREECFLWEMNIDGLWRFYHVYMLCSFWEKVNH